MSTATATAPKWSDIFGATRALAIVAPERWQDRLPLIYRAHVSHDFAPRHVEFWDHVQSIEADSNPRPFAGIWPRGGGKSTSAEIACTDLGVRGKRFYALYVRMTQELADKSVANVAALLESSGVAKHYPDHAERKLSKFGSSLGWRRNRVRTAGNFTVDAIGLDTAARGVKVEEQRPDLIILDDLDDKLDSPATTAKKISVLTHSILPAGSDNVAVIAIQNLIIPDGIFTRLVDGRGDYLTTAIVSGPHKAVDGLVVEREADSESGTKRAVVKAGTPTWSGQDLDWCQREIDLIGLSAFLKECQHEVTDKSEALALRVTPDHIADLTLDQCKALVSLGRVFGGIDFGSWRFAFTLWAVDRMGVPYAIAELYSQQEPLEVRARKVTTICRELGLDEMVPFYGDSANPTDIRELNLAFVRIKSPFRCVKVLAEGKHRAASVDRINDMLDRTAIKFRRTLGDNRPWYLGKSVNSAGIEQTGSRLLWELGQWVYPITKPGEAQVQDPDDDSADGADAIASMRYALMSWFRPADAAKQSREKQEDRARRYDFEKKQFVRTETPDDVMADGTGPRRHTRPVRLPRPRVGR